CVSWRPRPDWATPWDDPCPRPRPREAPGARTLGGLGSGLLREPHRRAGAAVLPVRELDRHAQQAGLALRDDEPQTHPAAAGGHEPRGPGRDDVGRIAGTGVRYD